MRKYNCGVSEKISVNAEDNLVSISLDKFNYPDSLKKHISDKTECNYLHISEIMVYDELGNKMAIRDKPELR